LTLAYHEYVGRGNIAKLFRCNAPEVLVEGPGNTGKSRGALEKINWACETYQRCRVALCRFTRKSMTDSTLRTLEERVLWPGHPAMVGEAKRANRHHYVYPGTNAEIALFGLDNPEGLYSTEWDIVLVDEATQKEIVEDTWEKFGRAMRNRAIPKSAVTGGPMPIGPDGEWLHAQAVEVDAETGIESPAFWTQRIACANPTHPGNWLNRRPHKAGSRMVRIKTRHTDNPSITAGELVDLRSMTGHRRARLYEGRWVAAEGGVYQEFDRDKHVLPAPFKIPPDWPIFTGYDPGFDHPTAWLWFAVGPNGTMYVIGEHYINRLGIEDHAKSVKEREQRMNWSPRIRYADPQYAFSMTAHQMNRNESIATQWQKLGIRLTPWPRTVNEEAMVNAVRRRLLDGSLKVFPECEHTIDEFESWSYARQVSKPDEAPPGEDKFEDKNNHAMDVIRGIVAANPTFARQMIVVKG
jgi:hypothetical protein